MFNGAGAQAPIRWIGLAVLVLSLMSYPWLAPALQRGYVFGLPMVMVYFFILWGLCIVLSAMVRTEP